VGNSNPVSGRTAELEELVGAVLHGKAVTHSGQWGMATLEACLAIMQSAKERREIFLSHQIAVPAETS
jgi:phthalate 4,5-cis-dihydrodiol dehydrogenase